MFCTDCGKENKDDASFCVYCGMALKCALCGKSLGLTQVRFASLGNTTPFCESCVGKFKRAKKELAGKSDDEIISTIKPRESPPHQPEADTTTAEADYPSPVREMPNASKPNLVVTPLEVVDKGRAEMTPESRWEYKHVVIAAATAVESGKGVSLPTRPHVEDYPQTSVEQQLQQFGQEGWELVSMEPQWFWERLGVSMATELTRPRVITAWFCTFKRKVAATG